MKQARGVDIVGDLLDREFLDRIAQMRVKSVMASSLFQYVTNRQEVAGGRRPLGAVWLTNLGGDFQPAPNTSLRRR